MKGVTRNLTLCLGTVALLWAVAGHAQESIAPPSLEEPVMEEVVVIGRLISSAQQVVDERLDDDVVADLLDSEMISRMGDSTVAAALRRISGLSLVNDKFVYVRGLGERYSSTTLNGAIIPSPDLTRNVIPLDIFPTAIVQSLQVQKGYSAERQASFGGGAIDIRTKSVPDGFTYSLEVGTGYNTQNSGDVLTYNGGSDDKWGRDDGLRALPNELDDGLARFAGDLDQQSILNRLQGEGNPGATAADADALNRELAQTLNRDISVREVSPDPDYAIRGSIGNNWILGQDWEVGMLVGGGYQQQWRETNYLARNIGFPNERIDRETETTRSVSINGVGNLGVRFTGDHEVAYTNLYIRSTDDETAIRDFFNENREVTDGQGFREYRLDFEERNMVVNQVRGSHTFGEETRSAVSGWLGNLISIVPNDLKVDWFVSDSRARTEIPNQVRVDGENITDPVTGEVISSRISLDARAADFRFTKLVDNVENYGWAATMPYFGDDTFMEFMVGYNYQRKWRTYEQTEFGLGFTRVDDSSILAGELGDVFSNANLSNPLNDVVFDRQGTNNQSYLAATTTEAAFAKFDITAADRIRVAAGLRWENYNQVAIDWDPYGFTAANPQVTTDPDRLADAGFQSDDLFPSAAITYIGDWWAETFQLRAGWSKTVVRPDLREITDASYIDPLTDDLVDGNPGVTPSRFSNYDVRAEWFFSNGDNLTISGFWKEINNPIEFFESAASDTNTTREIVNAESAEIKGIELEFLKNLGFIGSGFDSFFVQTNFTWQDSELVAGEEADAPTNNVRELAGASDFVVNALLGFDSPNARHSATIVYNVFGERLYVAGRNGAPDGFEQPFHSLDLTYSWYPSETMTIKAKVQNILDDKIQIERGGVTTFSEKPGTGISLSLQWQY